ncbi:MAG: Flp family type IVb pilin [Firmicutes bacterium]|nr:Flp family type IVb pilin [Bacillota bacterium]
MLTMARFYLKTRLFKDEKGQGMVEYGLILALVAVGAIALLRGMGLSLGNILGEVGGALDSAAPSN